MPKEYTDQETIIKNENRETFVDKWTNHFHGLMNTEEETAVREDHLQFCNDEITVEDILPDIKDVEEIICNLRNNKGTRHSWLAC